MSDLMKADGAPTLTIGTEDGEPYSLDANVVVTGRTCVIGASGSGKSYAVGVICEELCKHGVPFAIVDSEGEYSGLKEKHDVIWVADDEKADLKWGGFSKRELASQAPDVSPLILDVSESKDRSQKVGAFMTELYKVVEERRVPYLTIVEEADKFIPQVGDRLPILDEIARRGRKRGLGLMICTQRPSVVDKNILSQCGNQLIGKLVIRNDLEAVSQFFPERTLPKQLTGLGPGDFYAMGGFSDGARRIHIRQRETRPGGVTPQFVGRKVKPLRMTPVVPVAEEAAESEESEPSETEPVQAAPVRQVDSGAKFDKGASGQKVPLGIPFALAPDQALSRIRKMRSFGVFGQQEVVGSIQPIFRRLLELEVGLRKGLLNKRYEKRFSLLDAQTLKRVQVGKKLVIQDGMERLAGLDSKGVAILRALSEDRYSSAVDVGDSSHASAVSARKALRELESRRLVKSSTMGRVKVFKRTVSMPDLGLADEPLNLSEVTHADASPSEDSADEAEIREVVKGLRDDYDLVGLREFFYPLYKVELALHNKHRTVWIDGTSGEEIQGLTTL